MCVGVTAGRSLLPDFARDNRSCDEFFVAAFLPVQTCISLVHCTGRELAACLGIFA